MKIARVPLAEASAARAPSRRPYALALLLLLPALTLFKRKRREVH
ncbi:MAG TPA: hypothetical protein VFF06_35625 [Polyangia bacterium]|nr:hypothetical protein [Polyangia bacterium]